MQASLGERAARGVVTAVLLGAPHAAVADNSVYEDQIAALALLIDEIRSATARKQTQQARVDALDAEMASLGERLTGQAFAASRPSSNAISTETAQVVVELPEEAPPIEQISPGLQGAPNPLQEEGEFLTGEDLQDESFPNSLGIPGANIRFRLGGYAKLDFIQDLDYIGDRFDFELATIPVNGTPEAELEGRTTLHSKETRLNFDFRSEGQWRNGQVFPIRGFVELDFFADRLEQTPRPRLRHAYGVVGRFLAGRTWAIADDTEAVPGLIDFAGSDAQYADRAAQFRFQSKLGQRLTYAIGVEEPRADIGNPLGLDGQARSTVPNLSARLRWKVAGGSHLQLGGDLIRLKWQGAADNPSDQALGYRINLTGRWLLGDRNTNAWLGGVSLGRGSASGVGSFADAGNDAVITPDGLNLSTHFNAHLGYSHYWNPALNSTISTAWAEIQDSAYGTADAIRRVRSLHMNLIWFASSRTTTGAEVMWGERLNEGGARGDAWRIQFMVKFKLN